MRITPIHSMPTSISTNNRQNNTSQKNVNRDINFQGLSYLLLVLAGKGIKSSAKTVEKIKAIRELEAGLNRPWDDKFVEYVRALTKTPDSVYDYDHAGLIDVFNNDKINFINETRWRTLNNIDYIEDKNHYNIQCKKEFLKSFFENGNELTSKFLETFESLDDNIFKSFKEETIDTCLFSSKYNRIRKDRVVLDERIHPDDYCCACNPFRIQNFTVSRGDNLITTREEIFLRQIYNNLKLIATLDMSVYNRFIRSRRSIIEQSKQKLENHFARINSLTSSEYDRPQNLYDDYYSNIKPIG